MNYVMFIHFMKSLHRSQFHNDIDSIELTIQNDGDIILEYTKSF